MYIILKNFNILCKYFLSAKIKLILFCSLFELFYFINQDKVNINIKHNYKHKDWGIL